MGWGIDVILRVAGGVAALSEGVSPGVTLAPGALLLVLPAFFTFAVMRKGARYIGAVISLPLLLAFGADTPPDILIADTTQGLAIREGDGYGLMAGRENSFAVRVWRDHYLIDIVPELEGASCDASACVYQSAEGYAVSLIKRVDAFAEDCAYADLILTRLSAPEYCALRTRVIDRADLRQGGVHRLDWDPNSRRFAVTPAIPAGERPWRIEGR